MGKQNCICYGKTSITLKSKSWTSLSLHGCLAEKVPHHTRAQGYSILSNSVLGQYRYTFLLKVLWPKHKHTIKHPVKMSSNTLHMLLLWIGKGHSFEIECSVPDMRRICCYPTNTSCQNIYVTFFVDLSFFSKEWTQELTRAIMMVLHHHSLLPPSKQAVSFSKSLPHVLSWLWRRC